MKNAKSFMLRWLGDFKNCIFKFSRKTESLSVFFLISGHTIMEVYVMERKQNMAENESVENKKSKKPGLGKEGEDIKEFGQMMLGQKIHLLSVIGEIEGHECLSANTKTTKYEHVLPQLAAIEESEEIKGLLVLLNTVGGDVEAGLAIAEMIASISKPTVSLVLGGSHSIGGPIAVSTDYSFIVPTGTMVIHPVRMNGTVIGAPQTYDYFKQMQDRILGFLSTHCKATKRRLEELMLDTGMLTKDLGTILVGEQAVKEGLIDEVGGIKEALAKVQEMTASS
jgi:ATP-dependent protease ClpP protease subunit